MKNKERIFLLITFSFISTMILADLATDFGEGVPFWHIIIEGSAGIMAIGGVLFVLKSMFLLKEDLSKGNPPIFNRS